MKALTCSALLAFGVFSCTQTPPLDVVPLPKERQVQIQPLTTYVDFVAYSAMHAGIAAQQDDDGMVRYVISRPEKQYLSIAIRVSQDANGTLTTRSVNTIDAVRSEIDAALDPIAANVIAVYPIIPEAQKLSMSTPPFVPNMRERAKKRARLETFKAMTGEDETAVAAAHEGWVIVLSGHDWPGRAPRFVPLKEGLRQISKAAARLSAPQL